MLADHYVCKCGIKNMFSSWLYANWDDTVVHRCKCGRKNTLLEGRVVDVEEERTTESKKPVSTRSAKPPVPAEESPVQEGVQEETEK